MQDHDESRLPKWAQSELERLRRDLAMCRTRLEIGGVENLGTDPIAHRQRDIPCVLTGEGIGYQRFGVHGDLRAEWYLGNPSGKPFGHLSIGVKPTLNASPDGETLGLELYTGAGSLAMHGHSSNVMIATVVGR